MAEKSRESTFLKFTDRMKKKAELRELQRQYEEFERQEQINTLDSLSSKEQMQQHTTAALMNIKKILDIARELDNEALIRKYTPRWVALCQQLKQENIARTECMQSSQNQVDRLSQIINIDPFVAPEIEEVAVADLLPNLPIHLQNMEQVILQALEEHCVSQKHTIDHQCTTRTLAGVSETSNQTIDIIPVFPDSLVENQPIDIYYAVDTMITSNEADPIEEAFINDTIPYNYEVAEIYLDGEQTQLPSMHNLTPQGLELRWHITNLQKKEKTSFRYHLKPRISRTIVLPLKSQLQIIKTHSNMQEKVREEGIYNTLMQFINQYEDIIPTCVMEDIIPTFYNFNVQEQKSKNFPSSQQTTENFVKWKLYEMPLHQSSSQVYQLIEYRKLEDMKIQAEQFLHIDLDQIPRRKRAIIARQQEEAKQFLQKYNL